MEIGIHLAKALLKYIDAIDPKEPNSIANIMVEWIKPSEIDNVRKHLESCKISKSNALIIKNLDVEDEQHAAIDLRNDKNRPRILLCLAPNRANIPPSLFDFKRIPEKDVFLVAYELLLDKIPRDRLGNMQVVIRTLLDGQQTARRSVLLFLDSVCSKINSDDEYPYAVSESLFNVLLFRDEKLGEFDKSGAIAKRIAANRRYMDLTSDERKLKDWIEHYSKSKKGKKIRSAFTKLSRADDQRSVLTKIEITLDDILEAESESPDKEWDEESISDEEGKGQGENEEVLSRYHSVHQSLLLTAVRARQDYKSCMLRVQRVDQQEKKLYEIIASHIDRHLGEGDVGDEDDSIKVEAQDTDDPSFKITWSVSCDDGGVEEFGTRINMDLELIKEEIDYLENFFETSWILTEDFSSLNETCRNVLFEFKTKLLELKTDLIAEGKKIGLANVFTLLLGETTTEENPFRQKLLQAYTDLLTGLLDVSVLKSKMAQDHIIRLFQIFVVENESRLRFLSSHPLRIWISLEYEKLVHDLISRIMSSTDYFEEVLVLSGRKKLHRHDILLDYITESSSWQWELFSPLLTMWPIETLGSPPIDSLFVPSRMIDNWRVEFEPLRQEIDGSDGEVRISSTIVNNLANTISSYSRLKPQHERFKLVSSGISSEDLKAIISQLQRSVDGLFNDFPELGFYLIRVGRIRSNDPLASDVISSGSAKNEALSTKIINGNASAPVFRYETLDLSETNTITEEIKGKYLDSNISITVITKKPECYSISTSQMIKRSVVFHPPTTKLKENGFRIDFNENTGSFVPGVQWYVDSIQSTGPEDMYQQLLHVVNRRDSDLGKAYRIGFDPFPQQLRTFISGSDWTILIGNTGNDFFDVRKPIENYRIIKRLDAGYGVLNRMAVCTPNVSEIQTRAMRIVQRLVPDVDELTAQVYGKNVVDWLRTISGDAPLGLLQGTTQAMGTISGFLVHCYAFHEKQRKAITISLDEERHWNLLIKGTEHRADFLLVELIESETGIRLKIQVIESKSSRTQIPKGIEQLDASLKSLRLLFHEARPDRSIFLAEFTRKLEEQYWKARRHIVLSSDFYRSEEEFECLMSQIRSGKFSLQFEVLLGLPDTDNSNDIEEYRDGIRVLRIGTNTIKELMSKAFDDKITLEPEKLKTSELAIEGAEIEEPKPIGEYEASLKHKVDGKLPEAPAIESEDSVTHQFSKEKAPAGVKFTPYTFADELLILGSNNIPAQYGVIGEFRDRKLGIDMNSPLTIGIFGNQGSGKSYTLGTLIESALIQDAGISTVTDPLAVVVMHYGDDDSPPEYISLAAKNDKTHAIDELKKYGANASVCSKITLLVPPQMLSKRRQEYPDIEVEPIKFAPSELGIEEWLVLLEATGNRSLYMRQVRQLLGRMSEDDRSMNNIRRAVESMDSKFRDIALLRLGLAEDFLSGDNKKLIKPESGRLIIVDMRSPMLGKADAMALLLIVARLMAQSSGLKMFVVDEAHNFKQGGLSQELLTLIKLMRHRSTSVILATQIPKDVDGDILGLSKVIFLHRMNSPRDIKHLQTSIAGLKALDEDSLSALREGAAFVWTEGCNLARYRNSPINVRIRPRVTKHGGGTKMQKGSDA